MMKYHWGFLVNNRMSGFFCCTLCCVGNYIVYKCDNNSKSDDKIITSCTENVSPDPPTQSTLGPNKLSAAASQSSKSSTFWTEGLKVNPLYHGDLCLVLSWLQSSRLSYVGSILTGAGDVCLTGGGDGLGDSVESKFVIAFFLLCFILVESCGSEMQQGTHLRFHFFSLCCFFDPQSPDGESWQKTKVRTNNETRPLLEERVEHGL